MTLLVAQSTPPPPRYEVVFKSLDALCTVTPSGTLSAFTGLWVVLEDGAPIAYCARRPLALMIASVLNWRQDWLGWSRQVGVFFSANTSRC
jgi:hypothetical protein